jgi:hypothetical protein
MYTWRQERDYKYRISGTQLCKQVNRRLLMALGIEEADDLPSDSINIKDEEMGRARISNGN